MEMRKKTEEDSLYAVVCFCCHWYLDNFFYILCEAVYFDEMQIEDEENPEEVAAVADEEVAEEDVAVADEE